ncbi:MAG: type II toxin-antitoxin system Phd/YefM family antitoxin [Candidatus Omnitrophica bacterium]|nr:type II toxin-antitoxin system Phd/YefM family antitoxin [Candidatus Omnitrophota bacterium]MCA9442742.1 type II toxin-antitoxin system Phd/YefM family antitoxin [Candidatus Omnitrophota bacterium]MCB9767792.1 type II toxin-antitoxin system Phd/YefM family antitoxin [Candidatus Omnitrophota bacterium]MCB9781969.1 type II toxin-antitoxin system Phd/YefM family antitoxin [Candidatus Omnitrophota bacterium]
MRHWQLQEAKAKLSEVVTLARESGPQEITLRGAPAAVVVSAEDFARLTRKKERFLDFMRKSPLADVEIDIERNRTLVRDVDL